MKNECYDIMFRKKVYTSLEEVQNDIDEWLKYYNEDRPHSGKHCYGKTPMKTWIDSKALAREKNLDNRFNKYDSFDVRENDK